MRFTSRLCLCAVFVLAPIAIGAAEPPTDAKSFASVLRPDLPEGWTLEIRGDRVIIERTKHVEIYNGIGLPEFLSEAERRRYIKPNVRKDQFVISLRFGDHMAPAAVMAARNKNREAEKRAQTDAGHSKRFFDREFWERHPEYGYRELPKYDAGKCSIYREVSLYSGPWQFWSASVEQECEAVLSLIGKQFQAY